MRELVFASWNPQKVAELQRIVAGRIKLLCLADFKEFENEPQAEENGASFLENAAIKANYWAEKIQMPVIAEDSGIRIDALGGYPGVKTKRCVEELCPGLDANIDKPSVLYPILLDLMKKSGNPSKKAHWITAMVYVDPKHRISTTSTSSSLHGEMCECAGEKEFGFDQYFKPDGCEKSLAQLSPSQKDAISPRRECFENLVAQLF